jgi:putative tricarboxylic transport membrane protein
MVAALHNAVGLAFTWENLLCVVIGVGIGVAFGALPGVTGFGAIALALPFTFFMSTVPAMALLLGIYKGGMFGGAISAVTFAVPGDPSSAATVFDGYPLAKKGKPYTALNTALYSSVAGNLLADLTVIFTFVPMGILALQFGPRELFALMFVCLMTLVIFMEGKILKAFIGTMLGFFLATIGPDPIMNEPRLSFGLSDLEAGIGLTPFVVGLFAFSEMLIQFGASLTARRKESESEAAATLRQMIRTPSKDDRFTVKDWLVTTWRETLLGSAIGIFLGALPGPGGTMSAFSAYALAGRMKRNRGRMGTGIPEGIAAPEAADSSTVGPTLIPLFAFGIPGSATAALFMGAFMLHGIAPGPGLFTDYTDIMLAVFMIMLAGTLANLVISKVIMIPVFARLGLIDTRVLVPVLMPFMIVGMYAIDSRPFDVLVMVAAGLLGVALQRLDIPMAPTVVAYIIGPMLEKHFRRSLILGGSSITYWFASPIALVLYVVGVTAAVLLLRRRKPEPGAPR